MDTHPHGSAQPDDFTTLSGKSVLVTGGTGSFGQKFTAEILRRFDPTRLIILSRDEYKQVEMQRRFSREQYPCLRYFIGDVRDRSRLERAMLDVDVVVHAAALKHVPAAEYNPFECINTNVIGAENVASAALSSRVKRVLALSTDKAANPINLYGASKLASDKIFIATNNMSGSIATRFSVVRYGNVVGSRGSVLPFFRRLIAEGATSLPITDPRMTRFWISLEQGVEFVLSCLGMMQGGEIFIPKIPSMKIIDMAKALAPDLDMEIIGIRPGEKLHEVLLPDDDARNALELEDRYIIEPMVQNWSSDFYLARGATRVAEDFRYASDTNSEWLTPANLIEVLKKTEA